MISCAGINEVQRPSIEKQGTATEIAQVQPSELKTEADKFFERFPAEIPGAADIAKWRPHDLEKYDHCLVHIRQMHRSFDDSNTKEEVEQIGSVQQNIYSILDYLVKNGYVDTVRIEGTALLPDVSLEEQIRDDYEDIKQETGSDYFAGGAEKLFVEGRIKAKPGDTFEGLKKWYLLRQRANEDDKLAAALAGSDEREDILLGLVSQEPEAFSVVVLGGGHAFGGKRSCGLDYRSAMSLKDNLYDWNRKNPEHGFCLIEITPSGYKSPYEE